MSNEQPSQIVIEVARVIAPDGEEGVLLQLPDGYAVMTPESALGLAEDVANTAQAIINDKES